MSEQEMKQMLSAILTTVEKTNADLRDFRIEVREGFRVLHEKFDALEKKLDAPDLTLHRPNK